MFNVLLSHSPKNIMNSDLNNLELINVLKTINLILFGHTYNGIVLYKCDKLVNLVFKILQKEHSENRGFLALGGGILLAYSRVEVEIGDINGIIVLLLPVYQKVMVLFIKL